MDSIEAPGFEAFHHKPVRFARDELTQPVFRQIVGLGALAALFGWVRLSETPTDAPLLAATICGSVLLLVSYRLLARSPALASLVFLAGGGGIVLLASALEGTPALLSWLTPLAVAAGLLLGPYASLVYALMGAAAVVLLNLGDGLSTELQVLLGAGVLTALALRPVDQLVRWSWGNSVQITALLGQLRDERGQLNRTIKDLDTSYRLLEQTNQQLATARQEAVELRDLRNRYATNLSHELRTPLNVIMGFAEVVYLNPTLYGYSSWNGRLRHDLAEIQRNAKYLAQLVDDIVDLARADALAMPLHRERTQLREIVENVVATLHATASAKGLSVSIAWPEGLEPVYMDPVRISQVLYNLINNAIRYTDEGSVSVTVSRSDLETIVSVSDTGRGIPEDELQTIFNEFYQMARPKGEVGGGKGLGLAIAKRLVQLHGGRIWAESRVGQGSTFHFSLPLVEKTVSRASMAGTLPARSTRLEPLVAVMGDSGMAAAYLQRRIERYEFVSLDSGADLIGIDRHERLAAVILNASEVQTESGPGPLDPHMPVGAPIIECTLPSPRWIDDSEQFSAVLSKPISREALEDTLNQILGRESSRRVMVVDDDRGFVQMVARMLETGGSNFVVVPAYGSEEALRKARRNKPDVVLTDLIMPGKSGLDLARDMRDDPMLGSVPIVAITAATPGEDEFATEYNRFSVSMRGSFGNDGLLSLIRCALSLTTGFGSDGTRHPEASIRTDVVTPAL